jgi:hypothetical protein
MKIRNGFVSNSSSSSFIVAVKDEKHTKIKITLEVDLAKYCRSYSSSKNIFKTVEELKAFFNSNYGCDVDDPNCDEPWAKKQYDKAKEEIEKGKIVLYGSFADDNDDPAETMLCNMGLKDIKDDKNGLVVIHSDAGY